MPAYKGAADCLEIANSQPPLSCSTMLYVNELVAVKPVCFFSFRLYGDILSVWRQ